jgi:MFS family permease
MKNTSPIVPSPLWHQVLTPVVIIGALGYFVDIYDLILFSIVRTPSLKALGLSGQALIDQGAFLINMQMGGMLIGGILWGILGDRRGRVEVLLGSILLYSMANIANGLVDHLASYAFWRFLAGLGLAGELGGSITLVSEVLSKELRGYGTTVVATVGVMGAVVGGLMADWVDWRTSYFIGGGMGLLLLMLRFSIAESGMFQKLKNQPRLVARGQFISLFTNLARCLKYLRCIAIGLPSWFVIGILVTFSPEFAKALHIQGLIKASYAVSSMYLGLTFGDLLSGCLSQWIRSRKRTVQGFLLFTLLALTLFYGSAGQTAALFYGIYFILGLGIGYWVIFVTIGAEQFGTNIRATVTTTVPNFVRGAVVPMLLIFKNLAASHGILLAGAMIGLTTLLLAFLALWGMEETFGKDLDYHEIL